MHPTKVSTYTKILEALHCPLSLYGPCMAPNLSVCLPSSSNIPGFSHTWEAKW